MRLFKKKKLISEYNVPRGWHGVPGGWWRQNFKSDWWRELINKYKKDVDENVDPEKDAQKIYDHWIQSYLSK